MVCSTTDYLAVENILRSQIKSLAGSPQLGQIMRVIWDPFTLFNSLFQHSMADEDQDLGGELSKWPRGMLYGGHVGY
jgi:hypothetical protein